MTTFTFIYSAGGTGTDIPWTDAVNWFVGSIDNDGFPTAGDTAFIPALRGPTLESMSMFNMTIAGSTSIDSGFNMENSSLSTTVLVTNCTIGAYGVDVTGADWNNGTPGTAFATGLGGVDFGGAAPTLTNTGVITATNGNFAVVDGDGPSPGTQADGTFINTGSIAFSNGGFNGGEGFSELLSGGANVFVNDGVISIDGQTAANNRSTQGGFYSPVSGNGQIMVTDGFLIFGASVSAGQTVEIEDNRSLISMLPTIFTTTPFLGTIEGFRPGDTIDIQGLTINTVSPATPGVLDLFDGTTLEGSLDISPAAGTGGDIFSVKDVLDSGSFLSMAIPCFAAGTRVLTDLGAIDVASLRVGARVVTVAGGMRPVRWLGHRRVDCRRYPRPWEVHPVRVHPGAFGEGRPHSDLWLSPDHAVFVDGVLVPIRCLLNGHSIVQEPRDEVTYWHVELDRHDVLLAEGLPCESFLDTGNRAAFANGGSAIHMHPEFALRMWDGDACAPLVVAGARLDQARARLRGPSVAAARSDAA